MAKTNSRPKKVHVRPPQIRWSLFKICVFNRVALLYLSSPIFAVLNTGGGDSRIFWISTTLLILAIYSFFIAIGYPTASVRDEFLKTRAFRVVRLLSLFVLLFGAGLGSTLIGRAIRFEVPLDTVAYLGLCDTYQPIINEKTKKFPMMTIERIEEKSGEQWKRPFHSVIIQKNNQSFKFTKILKFNAGKAREINFIANLKVIKNFPLGFFVKRSEAYGQNDIDVAIEKGFEAFSNEFGNRDVNQLKIPVFLTWLERNLSSFLPTNISLKLQAAD